MKNTKFILECLIILLLSLPFASATDASINGDAPDQGHGIVWQSSAISDVFYPTGQSFTPSQDNISRIDLWLFKEPDYSELDVDLLLCNDSYTPVNGSTPSPASTIAHKPISASSLPIYMVNEAWVSVVFDPVVDVISGNTYWIVVQRGGDYNTTATIMWREAQSEPDGPYPDGQRSGFPSSVANADMFFRTWFEDPSVPEFSQMDHIFIVGTLTIPFVIYVVYRKQQ